jgi:hypothetical protein
LENEEDVAANSDTDTGTHTEFLQAWLTAYGHEPIKVGRLFADVNRANHPIASALPAALAEVQSNKAAFTSKAGLYLKRKRGAHAGNPDMWLESEPDTHTKTTAWRVLGGEESALREVPPEEATPLTPEENRRARSILEGEGAEQ